MRILPVFAGMIPPYIPHYPGTADSPRIRGDDPCRQCQPQYRHNILPVFAGMIRPDQFRVVLDDNSPRIRGDDPSQRELWKALAEFSPYSRG